MNVESILRAFAKHLRREEYGSAAQLANNELGDGRYDNVEHIADALERWEKGSGPLLERTLCFRSVYRSMLFEDSLRRAIGHFIGEHSLPPRAVEFATEREQETTLLSLRLSGFDSQAMDEWFERRWSLTRKVTQQWSAPKHNQPSRPQTERA
jgi:hypothetical protein